MIIDIHNHYRSKELFEELLKRGQFKIVEDSAGRKLMYDRGVFIAAMPEQYEEPSLDKRLRMMDDHGIDVQILSIPRSSDYSSENGPYLARVANDGIAAVVRKHPDRFAGLASIPIKNMERAMEELDRAFNELKMKGLCISGHIGGIPLDSKELWPFYERVVELDVPLLVHPGIPPGAEAMKGYALLSTVGFEFDLILGMTRLIFGGVLEAFPALKFIFSHLGGGMPFLKERVESHWEFAKTDPDLQTKISKHPSEYLETIYLDTVSFYKPAILCAIQCSGVDNLLFGTDYPFSGRKDALGDSVRIIKEMDICEKDKKKIFSENAKKLFKIS